MPDLTKVLTRTCASNLHWSLEVKSSRSNDVYTLSYSWNGGWSCTCPGFSYRGWCKHVRSQDLCSQRCGGLSDAFANCIYEDEKCPDCGEPTQAFYVGV